MKRSNATEQLEPWLSEGSDASPELRDFLRIASAVPEDGVRVERLRHRLGPWLAVAPPTAAAPHHGPGAATASSGAASAGSATAGLAAFGKACLVAVATTVVAAAALGLHDPPSRSANAKLGPKPTTALSGAATPPTSTYAEAPRQASPASTAHRSGSAAAPSPSQPSGPPAASSAERKRASLAEEAAELAVARQALASSPTVALALLKEHAAEHPRSTLAEERRLFTIEALVKLGRSQEAQQELAALRQRSPHSPHLARAERLLGVEITEPR